MFKGIAASRGIGIGSVCVIKEHDLNYEAKKVEDTAAEKDRFNNAIEKFKKETSEMAEDIRKRIGPKEAEILEGHLVMISDPSMSGEMAKMIDSGQCAESAVEAVCDMFINMFSKMDDDMMRQRASDISDVKVSILKILLGIEDVNISQVAPGTVLVAKDLTPSMTSQINKENVVGIITEVGGKTSHSAILARALEIPAVLSVPDATELVKDKETAIVDGTEGVVFVNPDGDVLSQYIRKREDYIRKQSELKGFYGKETKTKDGTSLELFCNIGTPKDAKKAIECDGEGIGLFRSEFLFMDNNHMPTEDEQFAAYKEVAETMGGKPVIIRTLDIGGDKDIPYLNMKKEENPFLGYRAVRYCLGNKDSYMIQLRAIVRASAFGKIKIMIPLVTCVDELREVKALVEEIKKDFDANNIAYDKDIEVGCMIETPAASLIADILAKEADFFSIGTNDLTQYTMSVDRGNSDVAYLYSTFQPSVLRSIKNIIECGNKAGIPVGMCGEAAADPLMIPLLISFGLTEFSVNPVLVLTARCIISKWSKEEADELTNKIMALDNEKDIVKALKEASKD
ncbi:phosphotransferase system, enzyme I, PtsI [Butyrivibrio hungatei DSM 14810]|uniref:Phosphoenolpyruvate-protein phosphotransferase n=1 Tax=Butyrivibrio hungatei DSM 14810 TaxID=1121132 RepID=A0A1M7RT01_9FIRM|nr:phosphoenolpyruvate--protein phosphotransferase [Butyrivibrio hungatei]SHN49162.1 phosphotransferase system, enzyme I, PtsI [Butyrivibrio hungatei DSM 14810]